MQTKLRLWLVNTISLIRIPLAVVFLGTAFTPHPGVTSVSIVALALAFVSDFVDGYLARSWGIVTKLGYILDGLGDRALYFTIIIAAVASHQLNAIVAFFILFRDLLLYATRSMVTDWSDSIDKTRFLTKLNAFWLRCLLLALLVEFYSVRIDLGMAGPVWVPGFGGVLAVTYVIFAYVSLFLMVSAYSDPS